MDGTTDQPAKQDTPSKPRDEKPKDAQEPGIEPSKPQLQTDGNAVVKASDYVRKADGESTSTLEIREEQPLLQDANKSNVKTEPERPQAGSEDATAKARSARDEEGPGKVTETSGDATAPVSQPLNLEKAPPAERRSTEAQATSQQPSKSLVTTPSLDEAKSKPEAVEEHKEGAGEKSLTVKLNEGDQAKKEALAEEEAQKENASRGEGSTRGASSQESSVVKTAQDESLSQKAEQPESSPEKSLQQKPEDVNQTLSKASEGLSDGKGSVKEDPAQDNIKSAGEPGNDAPEKVARDKPTLAALSQENAAQNKLKQDKPSQQKLAEEKPAHDKLAQDKPMLDTPTQGKPVEEKQTESKATQSKPTPQNLEEASTSSGKEQASEMLAQKCSSQVKAENGIPSQREGASHKVKQEEFTQKESSHLKSSEEKPSGDAKAGQQTQQKPSGQPLEPRLRQATSEQKMAKPVALLNAQQVQEQKLNQGSTQAQIKNVPGKQTLPRQSIHQTQQQKVVTMKPVTQKQAPAAAQRLNRVSPAAAQPRTHQLVKPPVPAKSSALIAQTAGKSTQTTRAPPAPPSNAQQSSKAIQVARFVMNFLGPGHPPPANPQLPTLNSLRTRLFADPSQFDSDIDQLKWQTREAIRTEFFKVLYPAPPPNSLLTLVASTEAVFASFHPRPFFFPGARVAVPTEAGSRRAATSLQIRYKRLIDGTTVAEALLHLDGPHGGGFQWVQAPALTPLSIYAPQAAKAVQKKTKRPRAPRVTKPRKKREKALPPAPPVPPKPVSKPVVPPAIAPTSRPAPTSSSAPTQAHSKTQTKVQASTKLPSQTPKPVRTPVPTATRPPAPPSTPAPRLAGVVARLARQEASGVYVPDALRGTSPPPRERIVGEGRFLSHVSGTMRSAAFDTDKVLGIERLVARRGGENAEYFVKWSGVPLREGSWESRSALLQDVPGLVRDFDIRHPERKEHRPAHATVVRKREDAAKKEEAGRESTETNDSADDSSEKAQSQKLTRKGSVTGEFMASLMDGKESSKDKEDVKKEDEAKKDPAPAKQYIDDVTGLPIPSWLDTPIVELNISGMVLQIRRPNEAVLHNDATSAVRDAKKRQTRFKQENIPLGERLFPLTKPEAKSVIDAAAKDHRLHNRAPIPFPRGIGRVSPTDHGYPFAREDVLKAPPSWDAYFTHIGMVPTDYARSLPPHMPSLDDAAQWKLIRARDDLAFFTACEHREKARLLLRESFRHTGAPPPEHIFRDGVRAPPGEHLPTKRKRTLIGKSTEGNSRGLLRTREPIIEAALKKAKKLPKDRKGAWFDETWACWRPRSN